MDLRGAAVVVTRWFGGTKLGTGRLARAYGAAADAVLERVAVAAAAPGRSLRVTFPYDDTGAVMRVVEMSGAVRRGEAWGADATLDLLVPGVELEELVRALRDATAGRCGLETGDEVVLVPLRRRP